ncbi:hypothetical protein B0H11DRAFT_2316157 [Mycena galericulata]|nr:hypothetical protein B0H11DRAFT_2316157 [Mycena galericulata]
MAKLTFLGLIRSQYAKRPPVFTADLTGKTVIVVGANGGLGFEATKHFARMNPGRLILACRSMAKGQEALEQIKAETGCQTLELWILDLAEFASVRRFADKFEQEGGRLDYLIANAAIILPKFEPSKDGYETALQVNCISMPLLALRLLPQMVRTAREHSTAPRIVVVASEVHYMATLEKKVLNSPNILATLGSAEYCTPKKLDGRYFVTKLLNIMFVRALNDRISASTPLVVNAVTPGYCYSNVRTSLTGVTAIAGRLMEIALALPTEVGSRELVWAALGEPQNPDKLRGEYIALQRVEEVSDFLLSPDGKRAQNRIWDELIAMLSNVDPRVTAVVDTYLTA